MEREREANRRARLGRFFGARLCYFREEVRQEFHRVRANDGHVRVLAGVLLPQSFNAVGDVVGHFHADLHADHSRVGIKW